MSSISPIPKRNVVSAGEENTSREEFLCALRRLGAHLGVVYCRASETGRGIEEVQSAFLVCPVDVWERTFGKPRNVEQCTTCTSAHAPQPYCSWEQPCAEGMVRCVGHWSGNAGEEAKIVLLELRFAVNPREAENEAV